MRSSDELNPSINTFHLQSVGSPKPRPPPWRCTPSRPQRRQIEAFNNYTNENKQQAKIEVVVAVIEADVKSLFP